ncbi:anthranilate synthase component I [Clostridium sp. 'White wine YQ']|uniref:anthranilate synthase component I n=1 Tax=Clostridium sp. 'White wine YQ' TaxID=3027474 RepID=UPI0023651744|nr:anthranilate synthase component I [Clostridium sp. 'White wine YQ']
MMERIEEQYITPSNIEITTYKEELEFKDLSFLEEEINTNKGALFSSNYEYPNRYSRWEAAVVNPYLEIRASGLKGEITALNLGGKELLKIVYEMICNISGISLMKEEEKILFNIEKDNRVYKEEERSKKRSIFTLIRSLMNAFKTSDPWIGLYGAFGYDLVFQFEDDIELVKSRDDSEDLVLYLPQKIYIKDNKLTKTYFINYDFSYEGISTKNKMGTVNNKLNLNKSLNEEYIKEGDYEKIVTLAKESFRRGDLFEVVPSYSMVRETKLSPQKIYHNLKNINPSPYNFFINLGGEYLIGSSPEMFVRVEDNKVETCPISGTIKRGANPIEDSEQIKKLINSLKDEEELTMCTDVDRNDKSRVCKEGTVKVLSRRTIEMYSHLIHTVDHVEGILNEGYDSLDAFLTHMWAVTLTGAPKKRAIEWIERVEKDRRNWYGGAVGFIKFNGDLNTGITLRTLRYIENKVEIRVGATLLNNSIEKDEEIETKVKALAMLKSLEFQEDKKSQKMLTVPFKDKKALIIDHDDSFVHTLGNYIKTLGFNVTTFRGKEARKSLRENDYDVVILSPGPGTPKEFKLSESIKLALEKRIPILGVCLGLQGIVEYFGGTLDYVEKPRHGRKMRVIKHKEAPWPSIKDEFKVGLYHSIYGKTIGNELINICEDEEGILMGVMHRSHKILAVQFHPESILTIEEGNGINLLRDSFEFLLE